MKNGVGDFAAKCVKLFEMKEKEKWERRGSVLVLNRCNLFESRQYYEIVGFLMSSHEKYIIYWMASTYNGSIHRPISKFLF